MKLLLTSSGLDNQKVIDIFLSLFDKRPKDLLVLMISYAQNENERFYINESRKELINLGVIEIEEFNLASEKFDKQNNYDLIYVCGGNTFSILARLRLLEIDKFIIEKVKNNKAVYVGVSAGSIIAGPNIEIAGWGSEGDSNDINLKNLIGFNLTNIVIYPHFTDRVEIEVESYRQNASFPVIELANGESILVSDDEYKIIK